MKSLKYKKISQISILLLLALFVLTGLAMAALPPILGGELKIGVPKQIETLDPALVTTVGERQAAFLVTEPLFKSNGKEIEKLLVYDYKFENDGNNIRIWLKPDLAFSDGSRLLSSDVLASFKRVLSPSFGSPYSYLLFPLKGARQFYEQKTTVLAGFEMVSELEFVLHFAVRAKEVAHWLANPVLAIVPARQARTMKPISRPVGTGPFIVMQHTAFKVDFLANENYHAGRAYLDKLSIVSVDEKDAERKKLMSGNLDAVLYGRLFNEKGFSRLFSTMGSEVLIRSRGRHKTGDQAKFLKSLIDCQSVMQLFEKRKVASLNSEKGAAVFGNVKQLDPQFKYFLQMMRNSALRNCQGFKQDLPLARQRYQRLFNDRPVVIRVKQSNTELKLIAERIALMAEQKGIKVEVKTMNYLQLAAGRDSVEWDFEITEASSARLSFSELKDLRFGETPLYRLSAGLVQNENGPLVSVPFNIWGLVDFAAVSGRSE